MYSNILGVHISEAISFEMNTVLYMYLSRRAEEPHGTWNPRRRCQRRIFNPPLWDGWKRTLVTFEISAKFLCGLQSFATIVPPPRVLILLANSTFVSTMQQFVTEQGTYRRIICYTRRYSSAHTRTRSYT